MPCACAEEICRSGSISKNHQLTNLNKCGKFHACIRNSTILALSCLAIISKLATNEISIFYVVSVAELPEQAGLSLAMSETLKTGFLASRPM